MTNTTTPLENLLSSLENYILLTSGQSGSEARDRLVADLAVYEYAASAPLKDDEVLVRVTEVELNAINELVSNTSYMTAIAAAAGPPVLSSDGSSQTFQEHLGRAKDCLDDINQRFFEAEAR